MDRGQTTKRVISQLFALATFFLFLTPMGAATSVSETDVGSAMGPDSDDNLVHEFDFEANKDIVVGGQSPPTGQSLTPGMDGDWNLYHYDNSDSDNFSASNDWVGFDNDSDGQYTSQADRVITGSAPSAGTTLYDFTNDSEMYVEQTGNTSYDDGEDILSVAVRHDAGSQGTFDGNDIRNFASDTRYTDGGVTANDVYDGDDGTGNTNEAIISNGGTASQLETSDTVVTAGSANIKDFGSNVRYADDNTDTDYTDGEAIVDGTNPGTLESSDTVLKAGAAGLTTFNQVGDGQGATGHVYVEDGTANAGRLENGDDILAVTRATKGTNNVALDSSTANNFNTTNKHGELVNSNGDYDDGEAVVDEQGGQGTYSDSPDTDVAGTSPADATSYTTQGSFDGDWSLDSIDASGGGSWDSSSDTIILDTGDRGTYSDGQDTTVNAEGSLSVSDGDNLEDITSVSSPNANTLQWVNVNSANGYDAGDEVFTDDDGDGVYTSQGDDVINDEGSADRDAGDDLVSVGSTAHYVDIGGSPGSYVGGDEIYLDDDSDDLYSSQSDNQLAGITLSSAGAGTSLTATNPWTNAGGVRFYDDGSNNNWGDTNDVIITDDDEDGSYTGQTDTLVAGTASNADAVTDANATDTDWTLDSLDASTNDAWDSSSDAIHEDEDQDDAYSAKADTVADTDGTSSTTDYGSSPDAATAASLTGAETVSIAAGGSDTGGSGELYYVDSDSSGNYTTSDEIVLDPNADSASSLTLDIDGTSDDDGDGTNGDDTILTKGSDGTNDASNGDTLVQFSASDNVAFQDDGGTGSTDNSAYDDGEDIVVDYHDGGTLTTSADTVVAGITPVDGETLGYTNNGFSGDWSLDSIDDGGSDDWDSNSDAIIIDVGDRGTYSDSTDMVLAGSAPSDGTSVQSSNPFTNAPQVAFYDTSTTGTWEAGSDLIAQDYNNGGTVTTGADTTVSRGSDTTIDASAGDSMTDLDETTYRAVDDGNDGFDAGTDDDIVEDLGGSGTFSASADTTISTGNDGTIDSSNTDSYNDMSTISSSTYFVVSSDTTFNDGEPVVNDDDNDGAYTSSGDTVVAGSAPSPGTSVTTQNGQEGDWDIDSYDDTDSDAWDSNNDYLGIDDDQDGRYTSQADQIITSGDNTLTAGDTLVSFDDGSTTTPEMFVDDSSDPSSPTSNSYDDGDDILTITRERNGGGSANLGGKTLYDFSTDERYTDPAADGYDDSEAVVYNSGSSASDLENGDTIVYSGNADLTDFSSNERFVEDGTDTSGFEQGSSEAIVYDAGADGAFAAVDLTTTSDDYVITSGTADLTDPAEAPTSQGNSGLVYVDGQSTDDNTYEDGEDILSVTLTTNGGQGDPATNTINNFASDVQHDGGDATYDNGETIVEDLGGSGTYSASADEQVAGSTSQVTNGDSISSGLNTGDWQLDSYDASGSGDFDADNDALVQDVDTNDYYGDVLQTITPNQDGSLTSSAVGSVKIYVDGGDGSFDAGSGDDTQIGSASDLGSQIDVTDQSTDDVLTVYTAVDIPSDISSTEDDNTIEVNPDTTSISGDSPSPAANTPLTVNVPHIDDTLSKDTDDDGAIDTVTFQFSENVDVSDTGGFDGVSLDDNTMSINSSDYTTTGQSSVDVGLASPLTDDTSTTTSATYTTSADSVTTSSGSYELTEDTPASGTDSAEPILIDGAYRDTDDNADVDKVDLDFSEALKTYSFDGADWTVTENSLSGLTLNGYDTQASGTITLNVDADDGQTGVDDGTQPSIQYNRDGGSSVVEDQASTPNEAVDTTSSTLADEAAPQITDFETRDQNSNAMIDGVKVSFSEEVEASSTNLGQDDLQITDDGPFTNAAFGSNTDDIVSFDITSTLVDLGTNATVKETGPTGSLNIEATSGGSFQLADNASNTYSTTGSSSTDQATYTDGAAPQIASFTYQDSNDDGKIDQFLTTFSETLDGTASNLGQDDLVVNNSGDFDGIAFGTSGDDSTSGSNTATITLGTEASVNDTADDSGELSINATDGNGFTLSDGTNAYTGAPDSLTQANYVDAAAPVIKSATTSDDGAGSVNNITTVMTEAIDDDAGADLTDSNENEFNLPDATATVDTTKTGTTSDDNTVVLDVSGTAVTDDTSVTPNVQLSSSNAVADSNGNQVGTDYKHTSTDDGAAPGIISASTADTDDDGNLDQIDVTHSESLNDDASTLSTAAYEVASGTVSAVSTGSTGNDSSTEVDVTGFTDTSTTPDVNLTGNSVEDDVSNTLGSTQTFSSTTDGAAPVLLAASIDNADSTSSLTKVDLEFSETISNTGTTDVSVNKSNTALRGSSLSATASTVNAEVENSTDKDKVLQTGDIPGIDSLPSDIDDGTNSAVLRGTNTVEVDTVREELHKGWNYVSFPIADSTTPAITDVMNTSNVDVIWRYTESGGWESYDPDKSNNDFTTVEGGQGYLVNTTTKHTIEPNVNNVVGNAGPKVSSPAEVQAQEGWNLLGQYQEFDQDADTDSSGALSTVGDRVNTVYKQTGTSLGTITDVNGDDNEAFETSEAFWVQVTGDLSDGTVAYAEN